ncbi:hypothetical protein CRE_24544 [Caenorhabditis remanei]|uniref:Uncharacterized protein n=1 Tax=Caenorhabditis remanei TaxID=31234 RepID=E3MVC1_CAERE|nr:hypothetical protein CRE_24544 [Caenorhabditis remanei]
MQLCVISGRSPSERQPPQLSFLFSIPPLGARINQVIDLTNLVASAQAEMKRMSHPAEKEEERNGGESFFSYRNQQMAQSMPNVPNFIRFRKLLVTFRNVIKTKWDSKRTIEVQPPHQCIGGRTHRADETIQIDGRKLPDGRVYSMYFVHLPLSFPRSHPI